MECLETKQLLSKTIPIDNTTTSPIVRCQFHHISFAISEQGHLLAVDPNLEKVKLNKDHVIDGVKQVVTYCSKSQEECDFYLRTSTNKIYKITFDVSNEHPRKRAKMDKDVAQQRNPVKLTAIASNVKQMLIHHGIVLISSTSVQRLNNDKLQDTHDFYTADIKISCLQSVKDMHSCFVEFFSLQKSSGLIYGTQDGTVHWRDLESKLDTLLFKMEQDEHVVLIDLIQTSTTVDALIAVGEQGTVICYAQSDQGLNMRQFNIQSPVSSIDKVQDLQYIVSTGIGKVSLLDLNQKNDGLEATRMLDIAGVRHVRVLDNDTFETISEKDSCVEYKRIEYKKTPITIETDARAMQQLIEETLRELAYEEAIVKSMKIKEQEMSDKLASANCTVYALKSINDKRELGLCNTLASTGFEFSVCPITKSNSNENCSLNTTAYLRICIKSSRFLELEGWNLSIQLFPVVDSMVGETKLISVVGFEPYYENGIERHVIWERDIELDLVRQRLPAKVSTTLIMAVDEDQKEFSFPVSELILDDIHFARPCSSYIKTSIERRGLDEISARFMQSYEKQKLHDRTGRYPFARLLQQPKHTTLLNQRNVHIRYTVSSLNDEQYRSILPSILGEGHSGDLKDFFHGSAEQALFTMASYPGCPVVIHLSRVAPDMIDFNIQCTYAPALFKVESILLHRIHHLYMGDTKPAYTKLFRSLEASVLELQQAYQQEDRETDLWTQLRKTMDILYTIHSQEPIGCLTFI